MLEHDYYTVLLKSVLCIRSIIPDRSLFIQGLGAKGESIVGRNIV